MKAVPDLRTGAVESDVGQGLSTPPGADPVAEDALIRLAELPRAGKNAAAIDPERKAEGVGVFERDQLRAPLGNPVEGQRRIGGERFGDPRLAQAGNPCQ